MTFQFREDGFFNMTKAAKHFGKDLSNFMRSPDTIDYLDALANSVKSTELIETKAGRNGGTWAHPKLAVFFARWLDVKFAVWCDMVIDDLLRGKAQVTITKPEESAVLALPKDYTTALRALLASVEQQEKLQAENLALEKQKAILQPKADTFDAVVASKRVSVAAFCRTLPGVNAMKVKDSLKRLGYLYRVSAL